MKNQKQESIPVIKGGKKLVFYIIAFLIPLFLIFLTETVLRVSGYGKDLSLFVESSSNPDYFELNKDIRSRFFSKFEGTSVSNDLFLKQKPDSAIRIFVMGCSTTAGFPYEMNISFSRNLYFRLQDALPHNRIEVVNTAMSAVNSYTQADFIDEILAQKPDIILIYTGHNEYYGALGAGSVESIGGNEPWLIKIHLKLIRLRIYQWVQNSMKVIVSAISTNKDKESATLMERIVDNKSIELNSDIYKKGINQFKQNMGLVLEKAHKAGVPVVFSDVVSNISGIPPLESVYNDSTSKACQIYEKAKLLESEGKFAEARLAYYNAKDLDGVRFRAPEEINITIRSLAYTYNAYFLGMQKIFEKASPNGIIGNNLITEHLHPNKEGFFIMSDAFFNCLIDNKLIKVNSDSLTNKGINYYKNNCGFTEFDSLLADIRVNSLKAGWPYKSEKIVNKYVKNYKPKSVADSFAIMCIRYENIYINESHKKIANIYLLKGDTKNAFQHYLSLVHTYPYLSSYYIDGAKILHDNKEYDRAISFLKTYPDFKTSFLVLTAIGKNYQKLNNLQKALYYYLSAKELIKDEENKEYILSNIYNAYILVGDTIKANSIYTEIIKINPNFKRTNSNREEKVIVVDKKTKDLINRAIQCARGKQYNEAIQLLEESIKAKETAIAYQMLGSIYLQLNDSRALRNLEMAYKLDPLDENTLYNLTLLSLKYKNYSKTQKYLQELGTVAKDLGNFKKLSEYVQNEIGSSK